MKNQLKSLLIGVSLIMSATLAEAITINGSISFEGTGTLNAALHPSGTPTAFTSFTGVKVGTDTQTGDYTGTDGAAVTMPGFTFNPSLAPNPLTQWSFTIGAVTYSFDLYAPLTVTITHSSMASFLTISGSGVAKITGFEDTPGDWSLSTQSSTAGKTKLTFSSDVSVPDAGNSIVLLGLALLGVWGVARMRTFRAS